jgi:hypothetical protein
VSAHQPENQSHDSAGRAKALSDARLVVAHLCANERSPEYKAAIVDALKALDSVHSDIETRAAVAAPADLSDSAMWSLAATELGTELVPLYNTPVIVLAHPSSVGELYRAIQRDVTAAAAKAICGIDSDDRERLLYTARVLRAVADLGRDAPLGELWSEAVVGVGTIKRILNIGDDESSDLGLTAETMLTDGKSARSMLLEGWKEAAIGWNVCASIHRAYARGKDPMFKTRQADFGRHAEAARTKYAAMAGPDDDTAAS